MDTPFFLLLVRHSQFSFREMLEGNTSKIAIIVAFLVILELIKTGFVTVSQEGTCADIDITVIKNPELIEDLEDE